MTIPCAVLMCHAPIVIPAIAGRRAQACARTTAAMTATARHLVEHAPDVIVLISPHAPRKPRGFGIAAGRELAGDFGAFGAPHVALRVPGAPCAASALGEAARASGLTSFALNGRGLDHGALVPLTFLREAGWDGPTLLISLPYPGTGTEAAIGRAIAQAAKHQNERFGVLASGDMSHRLTPDAPAGHHPLATHFDERFRELVAAGDYAGAAAIDPELRDLAAEDVVDSFNVAAAAVDGDATGHRVLCYEGPFGVGYLEAVLHGRPFMRGAIADRALLHVAREAIRAELSGARYLPPLLGPQLAASRGVFVTLRTRHGELRGCVGHVEPALPSLAEEIAACAAASATRDSRFSPVCLAELDELCIELSLLTEPEPIASTQALDPARYGVVVSCGAQRGVLLPAIEGIDTAADQVRIAARKAGLRPHDPLRLARFEVEKVVEDRAGVRRHELH